MSNPARGQTKNGKPAKGRSYSGGDAGSGVADWNEIPSANVLELIDAACRAGGAVRFGISRDGGAYSIGVYGDGPDTYSVYSGSAPGIEEHIGGLTDMFNFLASPEGRGAK